MSHFFVIATNENGIITDEYLANDLRIAFESPFAFSDVFIYSHGWWNTPNRATQDYNRFTIEFSQHVQTMAANIPKSKKYRGSLGIGIYWPSMLSADPGSRSNRLQAVSFYTMEKRADNVGEHAGYFLLNTIARAKQKPERLHLIGHSFGCKVVCNALQTSLSDKVTTKALASLGLNLVLIQAALDSDHLEFGDAYGDLAKKLPNLRVLATISAKDRALQDLYPRAQLAKVTLRTLTDERTALGAVGPTAKAAQRFGGVKSLEIDPGFKRSQIAALTDRFIVADLTKIHTQNANNDASSDHHSDIFLSDLYQLMVGFLFGI